VRTSGARSGRWWVINAAILLVSSYVLSACATEAASALSPTAQPTDNKIISVLIFDQDNQPINEGVTIRVDGQPPQEDDNDNDGFYLQYCIQGQYIIAIAPKYRQSSPEPCITGKTQYVIKLSRIVLGTGLDYSWVSARDCTGCHFDKNSEWVVDGHSNVLVDPFFSTMYMGTDTMGRRGPETQWDITLSGHKARVPNQSEVGPGYSLDYPGEDGNCAYCHLPAMVRGTSFSGSVHDLLGNYSRSAGDARTEGITCDICHKVLDVELGNNGRPYSDKPGVLSLLYAFPSGSEQVVSGPFTNTVAHNGALCSPAFSEGKFCAACHYGQFFDTVIYNSYGEWLDSQYSRKQIGSDGTQAYRSCQDCHMLSPEQVGRTLDVARGACSAENVNFKYFSHNMMQHSPASNAKLQSSLIRDAAALDVQYQYLADINAIQVRTVVNNVKAGHKFPTDSPLRHLLLVVDVRDEQQNLLTQIDGEKIPLWGGVDKNVPGMENYAGMPGTIFAYLLADKDTKVFPTAAYWDPMQVISDTRLNPLEPKEYRFSFLIPSEGKVWINVKLIYRYAFIDLAQQKSWAFSSSQKDISDMEVVSKHCVVDPKQPAVTACIP
jgi:hypothetical protein